MKKRTFLPILTGLLALLLVLLPACGQKNQPVENTTTEELTTVDDDPMNLVPKEDYKNEDFIVVSPTRTWATTAMTAESLNGETVNDAIFRRTAKVNERLNINIVDRIVADVNTTVQTTIQAGAHEFDLLQVWPFVALNMYQQGLYADQSKISTLNLNNDWWEHDFNDEVNVAADMVDGDTYTVLPAAFGLLDQGILNVSKVKTGIVTMSRLTYKNGKYTMQIILGKGKNPPKWEECGWDQPAPQLSALEIEIPDVERFAENVACQHYIITYGDHRTALRNLCGILGTAVQEL